MGRSDKQKHGCGEKITVASKKGCVFLKSLGRAPFAVMETKRGPAVVPDGFRVSTYSDKEWWFAETSVKEVDGVNTVFYQFTSQRNTAIKSDWKDTPTEAYKEVNDRLNTGFKGGGNGQLIIGCSYPSLQERILERFPEAAQYLEPSSRRRERKKRTTSGAPLSARSSPATSSHKRTRLSNASDEDETIVGTDCEPSMEETVQPRPLSASEWEACDFDDPLLSSIDIEEILQVEESLDDDGGVKDDAGGCRTPTDMETMCFHQQPATTLKSVMYQHRVTPHPRSVADDLKGLLNDDEDGSCGERLITDLGDCEPLETMGAVNRDMLWFDDDDATADLVELF